MITFEKHCITFFFFSSLNHISPENEHIILSGNVKMPNSCYSTLSATVEGWLIPLTIF